MKRKSRGYWIWKFDDGCFVMPPSVEIGSVDYYADAEAKAIAVCVKEHQARKIVGTLNKEYVNGKQR